MLFGLPHLRYHLYRSAVDMRKGFDGLSGLVRNELGRNPMSGELFIFINRRANLIKLLFWDITGYAIYYKRLERGTFEIPRSLSSDKSIILSREQLMLIMEGISLESVRKRRRYRAVPSEQTAVPNYGERA
jgi:transposase